MELTMILGTVLAGLITCYLVNLIWNGDKRKNRFAEKTYNVELNNNMLMSGERIDGYNRQQPVSEHLAVYGICNMGVTMDKREIYILKYEDVGV